MQTKNLFLSALFFLAAIAPGCTSDTRQSNEIDEKTDSSASAESQAINTSSISSSFDVNTLPVSNKNLGPFPYFKLPAWLDSSSSYGGDKNTDFGKLEVYTIDGFYPAEGRIFVKSYNVPSGSRQEFNEHKFVQTFSNYFESLGAKKLFQGKIPAIAKEALNRQHNANDYFNNYGHSQQENNIVYGLKNNGRVIFFSITSDNAYGSIAVTESAEFVQTATMLTSDEIQKDLDEKGKAVLHINFDTNKATLQPNGKNAVAEITQVLQANKNLKIDINGYTDNTGNDAHNQQLSKERAATVLSDIVAAGINRSRLASNGFGSKNPMADNSTEEGKAQNRRVELIKK